MTALETREMTNFDEFEALESKLQMAAYRADLAKLRKLTVAELRALMAHYGNAVKYVSDWPKEAMVEHLVPIMNDDSKSPLYRDGY